MSTDRDYMETNRRRWDELVAVHVKSDFYDLASFKAGKTSLLPVELAEVGDVHGKTLLHLQCHFGMDTLSWARAGASVTGIDFSFEAIKTARGLAADLGIQARFVESNLYDLPANLDGQFDIVFTSYGAICWLPDLVEWARIAVHFLKSGGVFYIVDGHPVNGTLDDEAPPGELRLRYPYFASGPIAGEYDGSYADASARLENRMEYGFGHGMGEIVTAMIDAGLRIEFLHEFPFCAWAALPGMEKGPDGYYRLTGGDERIPFIFSIRATKTP